MALESSCRFRFGKHRGNFGGTFIDRRGRQFTYYFSWWQSWQVLVNTNMAAAMTSKKHLSSIQKTINCQFSHMTSLKFKVQNYWSSWDQLFSWCIRAPGSKSHKCLLRMGSWFSDSLRLNFLSFWVTRHLTSEGAVTLVKKSLISENLIFWTVLVLEESIISTFWISREIHWRFCRKPYWQMALLVSGHHVVARLDGQPAWPPYTNLYEFRWEKSFSAYIYISFLRKIAVAWILARVYLLSFLRF